MKNYTLISGSCLDPEIYPNEKANLILFDPPFMPYSQAYKQVRKENLLSLDPIETPDSSDYLNWWKNLCEIGSNHLKNDGWYCYKSDSWTAKHTFPISQQYFKYSNEVIWDKGRIGLGRRIRTQHEQIECYTSNSGKKIYWKHPLLSKVRSKTTHGTSQGLAFSSILKGIKPFKHLNCGFVKYKQSKAKHINQTPPALWDKFIEFMCPPDGLVLDLTAGTCSIGISAIKLGRRYYAIELEEKYLKIGERLIKLEIRKQENKKLLNYR